MFLKYFPPFCKLPFCWTFLLLCRSFSVWCCLTCLFLVLLHVLLVSYPKGHCQDQYPYVQVGFRKGRGTRDQIANICWIIEKAREFQKTYIFALLNMPKPLTVWTTNCGKFFKRWEHQTTLPASWEICMQVKKQQLELDMEQTTDWFQIGKEYVKAVYSHPAYLTYMQSTSWEMLG